MHGRCLQAIVECVAHKPRPVVQPVVVEAQVGQGLRAALRIDGEQPEILEETVGVVDPEQACLFRELYGVTKMAREQVVILEDARV